MNTHPLLQTGPIGFDSIGCKIIEIDGPGDTTVRPCPPERLPILMAERQRLVDAGLLPPLPGTEGETKQPFVPHEWKYQPSPIIEMDSPEDTTVRPCPPERLPALMAERELW